MNRCLELMQSVDKNNALRNQKDFEKQYVYVNNDKKVLLYWNTKTGSSSLAYWFICNKLNREISLDEFYKLRFDESIHFDCKFIQNDSNYRDYDKIIFIRDPFRRIVSLFYNKFIFHRRVGFIHNFHELEDFTQNVVADIYRRDGKDINNYKGVSFNRLLSWIAEKYSSKHLDKQLDIHFTPQIKKNYLSLDSLLRFTYVFKTENIDRHLVTLNKKYNFSFNTKKINTSGLTHNPKKQELSEVLSVNFHRMNNLSYEDFLNLENVKVIFELYKEDMYAYMQIAQ